MTWSLRTRLTLSYVLIALMSVLLVSAFANGLLERQFRGYVKETQETRNTQIAILLAGQLRADGTWDDSGIAAVGMSALEHGEIIKVSDAKGRVVWDALQHNNGLCMEMLNHIAANMAGRYPNWKGTFTESRYPLRSGFQDLGWVSIGSYAPFFYNDEDLAFINAFNRLLVWAALASLVLSAGTGLAMARGISKPLSRVVLATQSISAGDLDVVIPLKTRVREIDGIVVAVNDLSRSLRTQESLRKRMTADMAHELRTPLATLQSHLEALMDGVWAVDRGRLEDLHAEILRLNRLVADLENLAGFESGSASLSRMRTDLSALVGRIVDNHKAQFASNGVELRFLPGAGGGTTASVDPDRISQVVINLLSNSLKFTREGGSVEVDVRAEVDNAVIEVRDTGCGIPAEDLPHVFERFYRPDSSRSRATGGSGIGLSIAKAIVEAHGGKILAESAPGMGSKLTVVLPREGA